VVGKTETDVEIKNGTLILEEAGGISPPDSSPEEYMVYHEVSGTRVMIPIKTLLRLHSILQFTVEQQDTNFEEYCNSFFEEEING